MSNATRRRVLSGTGIAGISVATGFALFEPTKLIGADGKVQFGAFRQNEIFEFKYKGRVATIGENAKEFAVKLNGRELGHHTVHRIERGRYFSMLYPFTDYSDPKALIRDIIDGDGIYHVL